MSAAWMRIGRSFSWLCLSCLVASLLITLIFTVTAGGDVQRSSGATPLSEEAMSTYFAQRRAGLGAEYVGQAIRMLAFLAFLPIGRALREVLGREAAYPELMALCFTAGGIIGAAQALFAVGFGVWVSALSTAATGESLVALGLVAQVWAGATAMLLNGLFLLLGTGLVLGASLGMGLQRMPTRWCLLSAVAGILLWLSVLVQLISAGLVGASGFSLTAAAVLSVSQLVPEVIITILLPVWCFWLAQEMGRYSVEEL
jgi:hypothetical protein